MSARLRKLSGEQGIAVVTALAVITVAGGLAAALVAGASTVLHLSSRDAYGKRALAAAQAGLNVAVYRFSQISANPGASFAEKCVTDREEGWKSTSPHCPVATGYLSDSSVSSSYYLTPDMSKTSLSGMSTVQSECNYTSPGERCVTAIGTVNGVTRRVQERVSASEIFNIHGVLGLEKTEINSSNSWSGSNFNITSDTASNGAITFGQNVNAPGAPYHCEIGPKGSAPCGGQNVNRTTNLTVPSVETLPFGTIKTSNSDSTITKAQGYNSETRSLSVPAGTTLALANGDYNFCYVTLGNGATLSAAAGARVRIFVDSPSREGSECKSPNGGKFNGESSGGQLNLGEASGQLEFYLYGTATAVASPPPEKKCNADFNFNNTASGASTNLYIYAPDSIVSVKSAAYEKGAIVGCQTIYWAESASARWDYPPSGTRPSNGVGAVSGSFRECTPTYSGDPESSCG
jgi:hypothetical protein